jgi:hypothetical protein
MSAEPFIGHRVIDNAADNVNAADNPSTGAIAQINAIDLLGTRRHCPP